ncbi:MAG: hypothetical protein HY355_07675 [Armatimonadetes bacterium]|nr:hypothetical protein [Armatimonadota bacterium]
MTLPPARVLAATLFLLLWLLPRPALAFDTWWHAEATRKAMVANGFSGDARLVAQFTNYLVDFYSVAGHYLGGFEALYDRLPGGRSKNAPSTLRLHPADMERLHFDSLFSTFEITRQWAVLESNTRAALRKYAADPSVKPGFRPIVLLSLIGASLHAVQDFYSHSNWVDRHVERNPTRPVPVWYEVPDPQRRALSLTTGAYPGGPGKTSHDVLNKDSSQQRLHAPALDAATRASIAWVGMLMQDASIPWDTLKAYNIGNDRAARRFLYDLDATFLTSTSIIGRHFDGKQPVKTIFHRDPARDRILAFKAAVLVLGGYWDNMVLMDNPYSLPTPYWAGFLVYHIERDLAKGLVYDGRAR